MELEGLLSSRHAGSIDRDLARELHERISGMAAPQVLVTGSHKPDVIGVLAAAVGKAGGGRVVVLDDAIKPAERDSILGAVEEMGLSQYVEWRRSECGRAWLLQELAGEAKRGPAFHAVVMENTRELTMDGLSLLLASCWLAPRGIVALSGINWCHGKSKTLRDTAAVRAMPELLRNTPQGSLVAEKFGATAGLAPVKRGGDWVVLQKRESLLERWRRKYLRQPHKVQPIPAHKASEAAKVSSTQVNAAAMQQCPLCGHEAALFLPHLRKNHAGRRNAKCPNCGALERDRLMWLYLQRRTNLLEMPRKRLLHIAPEACLERLLRDHPAVDYLSGDLESPWHQAMVKMDITNLEGYHEGDFDVVYCSHVLEHVPDDQRAINELYRVLSPGGWAIMQVPIVFQKTFEDPSIVTEEDRERFYKHRLHLRAYGMDYVDKLRAAGFEVNVVPFYDELPQEERTRHALKQQEPVFHCLKPSR